ncbi:hypothetical protein HT031_002239 [Scenedesmus sp. PABB004]|nr:hypothetical protein HT031_002239 [Scenedesmus sp. PABB004]
MRTAAPGAAAAVAPEPPAAPRRGGQQHPRRAAAGALPGRLELSRALPARPCQDPPSYSGLRDQQRRPPPGEAQSTSEQQQRRPLQRPAWPRPEQDVCKAVSLRLKRAGSAQEVLRVVGDHGARFNEVNTALAFAQLARQLRFDSADGRAAALSHPAYAQLARLAAAQAGALSARQVAMVLTALAWTSADVHADSAAAAAEAGGAAGTPAAPAAALPELLAARLQQLLDGSEPEDTCHCLWALTKLGQLGSPAGAALLAAATAHGLAVGWVHSLTAKPLSSLLWVHAQAHLLAAQEQQQQLLGAAQRQLPRLVSAVVAEVSQQGFLATWTPQELSMLLWGCAVLGTGVADEAAGAPSSGSAGDGSRAALPALPAAVVQQVCGLAAQQAVRFTPQGVANTCWALSKLLAPDGGGAAARAAAAALVGALASGAAPQLAYYKPQEVANLLSACARLRVAPRGLTATVEAYAHGHAHSLGAQDAAELLVGLVHLRAAPAPAPLRALLHRLRLGRGDLRPYQLAASAWACVKLAGGAAGAADAAAAQLRDECLAAAQQVLAPLAGSGGEAEAAWQQLAADPSGRPLVMLLWAGAACCEGAGEQPAAEQQRLVAALLPRLERQARACTPDTLVQAACALTRLAPAGEAQQQRLLQHAVDAVEARLLPAMPALPAQTAVLAAWALCRLHRAPGARGRAAAVLSACLDALAGRPQQQLAALPGHAVAALLSCCATAGVPPSAGVLAGLLAAAEQQAPHTPPQQQALLLWSLARLPPLQRGLPQPLVARQAALSQQLGGQLARALEVQLLHQQGGAGGPAGAGRARAAPQPQQRGGTGAALGGRELVALAAACAAQPQLARGELALAVAEAWQLALAERLAARRPVNIEQSLLVLWGLAGSQAPGLRPQLLDMLQQLLPLVQQRLAAAATAQQGGADGVAVLAARLLERLRCQPPAALAAALRASLGAALPRLSLHQLVLGLHAFVALGLPAPQLAADAAAEVLRRLAAPHGGAGLPFDLRVMLLWSLLAARHAAGRDSAACQRLLARLVAGVAPAPGDSPAQERRWRRQARQLAARPQLQQLAVQSLELLATPRFRALRTALCSRGGVRLDERALVRRLARLSELLLAAPAGAAPGRTRQRAELLAGGPARAAHLLAERAAAAGAQGPDGDELQELARLLPLWLQQQLHEAGLRRVAEELTAAGVAPGRLRLRRLANGDPALLLAPARRDGAGVAVVLEAGAARAAGTGRPLGPALARDAALAAGGHAVYVMPLAAWLPAWAAGRHERARGDDEGGADPEAAAALLQGLLAAAAARA